MTPEIFIPIAELVIPTGTQTNKAYAEIETRSVSNSKALLKLKQASFQHNLNIYMSSYIFHSLNH